jgi:hypothetical protein
MINAYLSKLVKAISSRYLQCGNTSKIVTKIQIYYSFLQITIVSSLALQLQRQIVINSAWKLWVWHCNCNAKLLQTLHESFDFGASISEKYSFLDEYVSEKLKMY